MSITNKRLEKNFKTIYRAFNKMTHSETRHEQISYNQNLFIKPKHLVYMYIVYKILYLINN